MLDADTISFVARAIESNFQSKIETPMRRLV